MITKKVKTEKIFFHYFHHRSYLQPNILFVHWDRRKVILRTNINPLMILELELLSLKVEKKERFYWFFKIKHNGLSIMNGGAAAVQRLSNKLDNIDWLRSMVEAVREAGELLWQPLAEVCGCEELAKSKGMSYLVSISSKSNSKKLVIPNIHQVITPTPKTNFIRHLWNMSEKRKRVIN